MGLFFEHAAPEQPRAGVEAGAALGAPEGLTRFNSRRFFVALGMFGALLLGGVVADLRGHYASSTALYGFAGTVFGVVAAFLGTEKSASR